MTNFLTFLDINKVWSTDFDAIFVPEIFYSLVAMLIIFILSLCIFFKFKKAIKDPLQKQKGLVLIACWFVEFIDNLTIGTMGERNKGFAGYVMGLCMYVFLAFTIGLLGVASPMTYLGVPLSLALVTFILIHFTAVKEQKIKYFKIFTDPLPPYIPFFVPVNLISMWAPLLSMTLRMFGNALSGYCIMTILYFSLESISNMIFGGLFPGDYWANAMGGVVSGAQGPAGMFIAPLITPVLHAYFDVFSGFIQTTVFVLLTMVFIQNEQVEDEDIGIETKLA